MSILEQKSIDWIGVLKDDESSVVLVIADHLPWDGEEAGEHLLLLQGKINAYLRFVESGELLSAFPPSQGKAVVIRIVCKELPVGEGRKFIELAQERVRPIGIRLEVAHSP